MTTYKELTGVLIKRQTTNPGDPSAGEVWYNNASGSLNALGVLEAFSSATPMPTAKATWHRAGTMTAGLFCAGNSSTGFTTSTEEWNGLGFSQGGAIGTALYTNTGFGTQTAGASAAGRPTNGSSGDTNACFEYDGSTWTSVNAANLAARTRQSFGIQTAGAMVGGFQQTTATYTNATEEYDGTNWTTVTAAPTNLSGSTCMGTQTAAIVGVGGAPTNVVTMLAYDGTNWTSSPSMNNARSGAGAGGTGATNTAGLVFGGSPYSPTAPATAEKWDGTSFTNSPASLTTARYGGGISDGNTNGIMVGGYQGTAFQSAVEEFNSSTNIITAAAWSSTNNQNTTAYGRSACGTQTAGLVFGGYGPSVSHATTETYDGSSFTEVADLSTARRYAAGFGLQTAAVMCGGNTPPGRSDAVEEWNGSSWGNNPNALPAANSSLGGAGTATAGLVFGGNTAPSGASTVNTQTFDGTSFSEVNNLNTSRYAVRGAGTQTAALCTGGKTGPSTFYNSTESWDGSSWTAVANFPSTIQRGAQSTASNTSALYAGGSTADASTGVVATSALYNGTIWVSQPSLGPARSYMAGFGTSTAMVGCGGYGSGFPAPSRNQAEEFTGETTAINIDKFTTS